LNDFVVQASAALKPTFKISLVIMILQSDTMSLGKLEI